MRIVFLGSFTEYKKVLILSMARIISTEQTVRIISNNHYTYENEAADLYDFCKTEIHRFENESQLSAELELELCDFEFIDIDSDIDIGADAKIVLVIEPERRIFEETLVQAEKFIRRHPYADINLVFVNILEYCKINRAFLEKLYERTLKDSPNITKSYEFYYDEQNSAVFQESMFEEKLLFRRLSPVWKAQLANLLGNLTGVDMKSMKKKLKKAERMK